MRIQILFTWINQKFENNCFILQKLNSLNQFPEHTFKCFQNALRNKQIFNFQNALKKKQAIYHHFTALYLQYGSNKTQIFNFSHYHAELRFSFTSVLYSHSVRMLKNKAPMSKNSQGNKNHCLSCLKSSPMKNK